MQALGCSRTVQSSVEFDSDTWPFRQYDERDARASPEEKERAAVRATNVHIFERAARCGNFEANIKLGVACLYGEGLDSSADLAYEMLNRAEEMVGSTFPFAWLLFRPPWSSDGCSKAAIFRSMKTKAEQNMQCWTKKYCGIMFCVAKTLSLQQDAALKEEAEQWFQKAAEKGCGDAAFELYQLRQRKVHDMDIGQKRENIRYLREYESSGSWNVRVRSSPTTHHFPSFANAEAACLFFGGGLQACVSCKLKWYYTIRKPNAS